MQFFLCHTGGLSMVHGDEDWCFNLGPRQMNDILFANMCFCYCMIYYSKART